MQDFFPLPSLLNSCCQNCDILQFSHLAKKPELCHVSTSSFAVSSVLHKSQGNKSYLNNCSKLAGISGLVKKFGFKKCSFPELCQ